MTQTDTLKSETSLVIDKVRKLFSTPPNTCHHHEEITTVPKIDVTTSGSSWMTSEMSPEYSIDDGLTAVFLGDPDTIYKLIPYEIECDFRITVGTMPSEETL